MPTRPHTSALFAGAPSRTAVRIAQAAAALLVVVAAALLPFAEVRLPHLPFFLPGVLTTAVMTDLFIAYLLYGQFIVSATPAIPVLAAAYVVRSMLVVGYTVASPGVILGYGHLPFGPQVASWMLIVWHLAFPVLVAAYALIEARPVRVLPANRVIPALGLCILATLTIGAGVFGAIYLARDVLPHMIDGGNYRQAISSGVAPFVLILDSLVLLLVIAMLRGRSVIQLWLAVAMLASLLDTALIAAGGARETLGWYASHLVALSGSAILLAALLHEMTLLYASLAVAKADLAVIAETDSLTGLGNRRQFDAALHREWLRASREGTTLALLMIDIDRFKAYNDRFGHVAGDACLHRVAGAIAAAARRPADLPARYGGEEFAVILPDTDIAGARHIAEELRRAVHALAIENPGGADGKLTVSIGIATRRRNAGEAETSLVSSADAALYRAKTGGRNRVVAEGDPRIAVAA